MVTVRVSDGHNEDLAFDIYIAPGPAPVECLTDLFVAMSRLHRAHGGEGLTFKVVGAGSSGEGGERTMVTKIKEPGLVVRLRSGGPPMTVVGRDEDNRVVCNYFNAKLELVCLGFDPVLLKVDFDAVNNITVLPDVKTVTRVTDITSGMASVGDE